MPNPNPSQIPDARYQRMVTDAMRDHNLSRREAEGLIDPGLAPFPKTTPASLLVRTVAKMQRVWKGGAQ